MTARPHPGGHVTTPAGAEQKPPDDDLAAAVNNAVAACHRVERAIRRAIATHGVSATARRLGVSRATAQRFKAGRWHITATLTKLRDRL